METEAGRRMWTEVDSYIEGTLHVPDATLAGALQRSSAAGLPNIAVSPAQGKFLHLLARMCDARRILEIGTLGGYSTIWLARALASGGKLVSLEIDPRHAAVATENCRIAGLEKTVEIRVGPASEALAVLAAERVEPFDLFFIDADKPSNPLYLEWAIKMSHPGSVIVVDNVIRHGDVINVDGDASVQGARQVLKLMGSHPRLSGTALQTVGAKGYDGFAVAIVLP